MVRHPVDRRPAVRPLRGDRNHRAMTRVDLRARRSCAVMPAETSRRQTAPTVGVRPGPASMTAIVRVGPTAETAAAKMALVRAAPSLIGGSHPGLHRGRRAAARILNRS